MCESCTHTYLYNERADAILLHDGGAVRTALGESGRIVVDFLLVLSMGPTCIVVDVLDVEDQRAATGFARCAATTSPVVSGRHVQTV